MSNKIVVVKSDGSQTNAMAQTQAENYLGNPGLLEKERLANLKQALNQVTNGSGKATGSYTFNGNPVLHASSGKPGVKSVCLFYYDNGGDHYIVAMGEHENSTTYKLSDYGQPDGDFKGGKRISL